MAVEHTAISQAPCVRHVLFIMMICIYRSRLDEKSTLQCTWALWAPNTIFSLRQCATVSGFVVGEPNSSYNRHYSSMPADTHGFLALICFDDVQSIGSGEVAGNCRPLQALSCFHGTARIHSLVQDVHNARCALDSTMFRRIVDGR